jgi:hypothetical protein
VDKVTSSKLQSIITDEKELLQNIVISYSEYQHNPIIKNSLLENKN